MADVFEVSHRKIALAQVDANNFEAASRRFWQENPSIKVIEPHPQHADREIHKLRMVKPLPVELFDHSWSAVSKLRSALDNAVYAVACAVNTHDPRHAHFPFAGSAIEFDKCARGLCKDVPEDMFQLFKAYQPYRGGNDMLWALNQVAITEKHKILRVGISAALGNYNGTGFFSAPLNPIWDRAKEEVEILTCSAGGKTTYKMDFAVFESFDEVPIVAGQPALAVLDYFARIVDHIVAGIEAEAIRLGYVK